MPTHRVYQALWLQKCKDAKFALTLFMAEWVDRTKAPMRRRAKGSGITRQAPVFNQKMLFIWRDSKTRKTYSRQKR